MREKLEDEILCRELIEKELDSHKDSLLERNKEIKSLESAMIVSQQEVQALRDSSIPKEMPVGILDRCVDSMEVGQYSVDEGAVSKKRKLCT